MRLADLDAFDDEALRTFLDPADGGMHPRVLGAALRGCDQRLILRVVAALPDGAADECRNALQGHDGGVAAARSAVIGQLFWPLLYWNDPDEYVELVHDERIHPGLFDILGLDGAVVCDIGAGAGRFTLVAAPRAAHVIAVDAVPALLQRLDSAARNAGHRNVETRRGAFAALPVADGSVDLAVACSSFMTTGPHGGERALREAERITRPGGLVAILWPQEPAWFVAHGFEHVVLPGHSTRHFADVAAAERLCAAFYSAGAAAWVRENHSGDVPFQVLGMLPPNNACLRRVPPTPSP